MKSSARTPSASRDDGGPRDVEWIEMSKNCARSEGAATGIDCSERRGHFQQLFFGFLGEEKSLTQRRKERKEMT